MFSVGKALKAHGIMGYIKVEHYTDSPSVFTSFKKFFIDEEEYEVENYKLSGQYILVKLVGVDDMSQAETFRNKEFFVEREQMPVLSSDVFYIGDLIGCQVYDDENKYYGFVENVLQYGSADVIVLQNNGQMIMFPFLKKVVAIINTFSKVITVNREEFEKVVLL